MAPKRWLSFLRAGLIAPIAGGVWAGLLFSIFYAAGDAARWPIVFIELAAVAALYASFVTLVLTWTLGLAWHAFASAMGWRRLSSYVAAGGGVGALAGLAIALYSRSDATAFALISIFWLGSTGAIVAGTGWLLRRPDHDTANLDTRAP